MEQTIKITNSQDCVTIDIEGTIGIPEQWQFDEPQQRVATYETFRHSVEQIEQLNAKEVVVNIRSTGGDVNDALLIYDALRSLTASITTRCYGYVASAATLIAQAASEGQREISSNALYLVHNSQCSVEGNAEALAKRIELLTKSDERLAEIYAERSGGEVATYRELMAEQSGEGRWLNAKETIELGLADCVIEAATVVSEEALEAEKAEKAGEAENAGEAGGAETTEESFVERAVQRVRDVATQVMTQIRGAILQEGYDGGATQSEVALAIGSAALSGGSVASTLSGGSVASAVSEVSEVSALSASSAASAATAASSASSASVIAFEEGQKQIARTEIAKTDDPSLNDVRRTANEEAYRSDARRLQR